MNYFLALCFTLVCTFSFSQTTDTLKLLKEKNGQVYLSWGYTRAWYSKSNIHFKNHSGKYNELRGMPDNYDFTIYNVTAGDRPDFDKLKDVINVTIPQFVFRVGYMFNSKWGIEMNYDHTKYVVTDGQRMRIKGEIDGVPIDKDTTMGGNFLHFEHTDGANFWMVNAVRKFELYKPSKKFIASAVVKSGAGIVFPRTDVTIFGQRLNNNWHIAGWIVGAEGGLRLEFLKHGLFEFTGKASYADYRRCLVLGKGNGNANHHFFTGQLTATIGYMFGI
ncbi:MAG: hypothetical protein KF900_07670 [Bacteroidetes bacterium]|nr:hypothetical protein [Bacteroidota bacterium]